MTIFNKMKNNKFKITFFFIFIFGLFSLYGLKKDSKSNNSSSEDIEKNYFHSEENSKTHRIERGEILQKVTISGLIESLNSTLIVAPYSGYVKKIYVGVGDKIKKDTPIISLTQTLESKDNNYPLRAPFDGTVTSIGASEGEFFKQDDLQSFLLRIDDMSKFFVRAKVPEMDIVKLKKEMTAIVKVAPLIDATYNALITEIDLSSYVSSGSGWMNNSKVEFECRLEITDADEKIRPGMSIVADIITYRAENVLRVPFEYVLIKDDSYFVKTKEGKQKKITVKTQTEELYEVIDGVSEGEELLPVDYIKMGEGI